MGSGLGAMGRMNRLKSEVRVLHGWVTAPEIGIKHAAPRRDGLRAVEKTAFPKHRPTDQEILLLIFISLNPSGTQAPFEA